MQYKICKTFKLKKKIIISVNKSRELLSNYFALNQHVNITLMKNFVTIERPYVEFTCIKYLVFLTT